MISLKNLISGKKTTPESGSQPAAKTGNIFGQTLNVGQAVKSKKIEYLEQKNKKRAYVTLGFSFLILALYSVFFLYDNTAAYLQAPAQISKLEDQIKQYNDVIIPTLQKTKEMHKAAYDKQFQETIAALKQVFPAEEDKLGLVSLFESFSTEVDASYPPFELTTINLGPAVAGSGYSKIPVSMSIHSSLAGFNQFLSLVDRSGYIYEGDGKDKKLVDKPIRLMSISSITIKYRGIDPKTGKDQGVDFNVKLDVYSSGNLAPVVTPSKTATTNAASE